MRLASYWVIRRTIARTSADEKRSEVARTAKYAGSRAKKNREPSFPDSNAFLRVSFKPLASRIMSRFAKAVQKKGFALRKMLSGFLPIGVKSVLFLIDRFVCISETLAIAVLDQACSGRPDG